MTEPDFEKMSPQEIAEYQRQNCIFCKIIAGDIPARKVYADDKVVCIMDIYPSRKGHMLVMPRDHYPVLPAIPKETTTHMFRIAKDLSKAGKGAVITDRSTIFIANGGVAGQQSPHFLFHIVPRENGDGLDNFNVPAKELESADSEKLLPILKQRMSALVASLGKSQIREAQGANPNLSNSEKADTGQQANAEKIKYLAQMILDNPQLKELIINDPAGFKREVDKIPDMKMLFADVDIGKLAHALGKIK